MFTSTVIQKSDDFFGINFIKFLFQTVCTFHILIPMAKCPRQEFASFILLCSVQRLKNRTFKSCAQCVVYSYFMHEGKAWSANYFWVVSVTENCTFSTFVIRVLTHFWYSIFIFGVLQHVIDYSAPSGIAEEGVLIVYDEAVKIRALVLNFKVEHRIQQQKQRPEHSSIFSFKLMHVKDSITNQKRNHPLLKRKKNQLAEREKQT